MEALYNINVNQGNEVLGSGPSISELTEDNAKQFVNPKDIKARLYFETEDGGNEALADELEGKELNETHVKPLIRRKENQGGNGGGNGGGNNPDENVLG